MSKLDLYQVLGVAKGVSAAELKKAYRRIAKKNHPDMCPDDPKAEERFKVASAAFEVLSDPKKRALYDEFGEDALRMGFDPQKSRSYRQWKQQSAAGKAPPDFNVEDLFHQGPGQEGFSFSDLGDVLSDLFGASGKHPGTPPPSGRPRPRRKTGLNDPPPPSAGSTNLETSITIPFKTSILGGKTKVSVRREGNKRPSRLTINVPVGIREGQKIRLAGQGMPAQAGGRAGDLLIKVGIKADPRFDREGQDLLIRLPLRISEAALGAELEIPTLEGSVRLKIPAGAYSGKRLRLKGKGVPAHGRHAAGHQFVELQVLAPKLEKADEATRAALDLLDSHYSEKDLHKLRKSRHKKA